MKFACTYLNIFILSTFCFSSEWELIPDTGQLAIIKSNNSMFPHPSRINGHIYKDSLYNYKNHYADSSVAIFLPEKFHPVETVDIVFYFHGWGNNIHKSIDQFKLLEQFSQSGKNAVLVFPEGPKNAPDSFGGKLEEQAIFKNLVTEVLDFLYKENKTISTKPGHIILAGHSGAYRVISAILNRGGLTRNIKEVYLFDGLYGQMQKYTYWLTNFKGRFINLVTPDGGTYYNSKEFLVDFADWSIPFYKHDKNDITESELNKERIIFIFSNLGHGEVVNPYLKIFLETSSLRSN